MQITLRKKENLERFGHNEATPTVIASLAPQRNFPTMNKRCFQFAMNVMKQCNEVLFLTSLMKQDCQYTIYEHYSSISRLIFISKTWLMQWQEPLLFLSGSEINSWINIFNQELRPGQVACKIHLPSAIKRLALKACLLSLLLLGFHLFTIQFFQVQPCHATKLPLKGKHKYDSGLSNGYQEKS